jgi:hypothetical protein
LFLEFVATHREGSGMASKSLRLSVVIPTRNRPEFVSRLVQSLESQSLQADAFEIILVDDGSEPPFDIRSIGSEPTFKCTTIYRNKDHGAHAARLTGLLAAKGARVVFLDDDVLAEHEVLEAHASTTLDGQIALGPILYLARKNSTPFYRYMANFYEQCNWHVRAQGRTCRLEDYYICNSSGPRQRLIQAFQDVSAAFPRQMAGSGFDESLLAHALASRGGTAVFLPEALLWHDDRKTLGQACEEFRRSGAAAGWLLCEPRFERAAEQAADWLIGESTHSRLRRLAMRGFWAAPGPFLMVSAALGFLAAYGPKRLVPRWFCYPPILLARWGGIRSVIPTFDALLQLARAARAD